MVKVNKVTIGGEVVGRTGDFTSVLCPSKKGLNDIYRVWNIPESFKAGDHIFVNGRIVTRPRSVSGDRFVVAIEADDVEPKNHSNDAARVNFSGRITAKGFIQYTKNGMKFIKLNIKLDKDTVISVIAWDGTAEKIWSEYKCKDLIEASGYIFVQHYVRDNKDKCDYEVVIREIIHI